MIINLFGQRNILGAGIHFASFADALKRDTVFNKIIKEWDITNPASLIEVVSQTNEGDINIWFPGSQASIPLLKGKNILWAIFESDLLPPQYIATLLKADLVWTPSNWAKRVLVANGFPEEKIDVVPEGVDQYIFHPFKRKVRDSNCYHFLAVGKYEQRKGYDQLLQAFKKEFSTNPEVQLFIKADYFIDDERAANKLKNEIEKTGLQNIKMIRGAVDVKDLLELYRNADGFVLPSRAEGWGLTLVEALACGLPTATVNYSGQTEYLSKITNLYLPVKHKIVPIVDPMFKTYWPSDSGDWGNWAEADVDDLADQMRDMVKNQSKWDERALLASAIIRAQFNWSKAVNTAIESLERAQLLRRPKFSQLSHGQSIQYALSNNFAPTKSVSPISLVTLVEQGLALHLQGQLTEAQAIYEHVLRIQPDHFDALQLLGTLSLGTKQFTQALDLLTSALQINPNHAASYSNRGNALLALQRFEEAIASFDNAIRLKPDLAEAYSNRSNALQELQRFNEALVSCDQAIRLKPDYAEAHSNRGNALQALQRVEEAITSFDSAIRFKTDYADAYFNRGNALQALQRFEEAITSFDGAICLKPDYAEAYSNRGNALQALQRFEEAIASYHHAIAINPDCADAHWNLSLCYLLGGNFRDGWQEYEWRWKSEESSKTAGVRSFSEPLWLGVETLKEKTILLYAEQGLGDTIQFSRYVPLVAQLGAKVILEVQRPLVNLLKNVEGLSQILAKGDTLPAIDYQCPLLSLPLAFKTELDSIPPLSQKITGDCAKIIKWQTNLGVKTKPRVGLVWSGSVTHKNDHHRSITLSKVLPHLPSHVEYVCLQAELRDVDIELIAQQTEIKYFGDALEDFTDTAALCELMDLVISVDTSVAHLSAALGKKTWVLLPYTPDWRWQLERSDSPWYPSIQLYRQPSIGDWTSVLEKVKLDLIAALPLQIG